jgi:hypothetical protein
VSDGALGWGLSVKQEKTLHIILPVVLYVCETWSLTLREDHRAKAFENRVLNEIFAPKWDRVIENRRRLRNEKLHDLYSSPNIIRVIKSRRMRKGSAFGTCRRQERCIQGFGVEA